MAVREERDQGQGQRDPDGVSLAELDRATYHSAGIFPMSYLQALDASHLEAAIRLHADAILTYDHRPT